MGIRHRNSTDKWNRKILNILWFIWVIAVVAGLLGEIPLWNEPDQLRTHLYDTMLKQNLMFLAVNLLSEAFFLFLKKGMAYILIFAAGCVSFSILMHAQNHGADVAIVFPVMISILYFNYGTVLYATALSILLLIVLRFMDTGIIYKVADNEVILVTGLIVFTTVISLGIVRQGNRLLRLLRDKLKSEEELNLQNRVMKEMIKQDALTGAYNHKAFHESMEMALKACEADNQIMHLVLIDIDNFKEVNDTYGHAVGDIVIRSVTRTLKRLLHKGDIISRYGGEEFAVIIMDRNTAAVMSELEAVRSEIEATIYPEMGSRRVTVSIGIHQYLLGEGKETSFRLADKALYTAKKTGKNKMAKA
jgi:diguanylate cyclase (GGDEF)-like protein